MKEKLDESITFRIEKEKKEFLDKIAEKEGRPRSNLMMRIVDSYLKVKRV